MSNKKTYAFYQESNVDTVQVRDMSQYDDAKVNDLIAAFPDVFTLRDTEDPTDEPVLVMLLPDTYSTPSIVFTRGDLSTYLQTGVEFIGSRPPHRPK